MNSRTEPTPTPWPAAAEPALRAGTRLDDYEIEQVLAQSSLAVVYRAYDHGLRLPVAIKEYMPEALAQRSGDAQVVLRTRLNAQSFERGLRAFVGEAQTLARFEHPSLLRIDRILQRNGTAYRIMRYTPGPTLLEHRRALARAPDAPTLRAWLDALLGALEVLHAEGWVHASVSPGNILLLPDGRPLLLDFGAVRAAVIGNGTQGMLAALEPSFEPIEQRDAAAGLALGPWTDLYSLAATLRFCISGKLPAPPGEENPKDDGWGLRSDSSALAASLVAAVEACLAEAPQDRPQSVAQVRQLLDRPGALRPVVPADERSEPASPAPSAASEPVVVVGPDLFTVGADPALAQAISPAAGGPRNPPAADASMADSAADAARAKVIADLEQTFALIAAQAGEDGAAAAPRPPPAPLAPPARPAAIAAVPPRPRRRWPVGVAALALAGLLLGAWLLLSGPDRVERPAESTPAVALAPAVPAPAPVPPPSASVERAPAPSIAPPAAAPDPHAASAAPPAAVASTKAESTATPVAVAPTARASTRPTAVATPGPRAQCSKRSGYALYQCMQTQCAKRNFVKHPECQRLRKTQRLD